MQSARAVRRVEMNHAPLRTARVLTGRVVAENPVPAVRRSGGEVKLSSVGWRSRGHALAVRRPGVRVHDQGAVALALRLHHGITPQRARIDDAGHRPRAVQPHCRVRVRAPAWVPAHRPPVRGGNVSGCSTRSTQPEFGGIATKSLTWLSKNARQDGDDGFRRLTMYLATGRHRDLDAELGELVADAWSAPGHVRPRHLADQLDELAPQRRPTPTASPTPARPEALEPFTMPPDHRPRLDDRQGVPPRLPTTGQDHPQSAIPAPETRASRGGSSTAAPARADTSRWSLRPARRCHAPDHLLAVVRQVRGTL
jgi:hypothetical protein